MTNSAYNDRFGGIGRVYGVDALQTLRRAHVAVVGIGGVGSWVAEALARTGVGHLTLVDLDEVCVTNTNRQIVALQSTVGRPKVQVMRDRIADIAPELYVEAVPDFYTPDTADEILAEGYDVLIDAIDAYRDKKHLIVEAHTRGIPLVVVGGAGGRIDPSRIQKSDLNRTTGDALLARLRRDLRKLDSFDSKRPWKIPTIYTDEPRRFPDADGGVCDTASGQAAMDCRTGMGALTWVTGTMGFWAASAAVDTLLNNQQS